MKTIPVRNINPAPTEPGLGEMFRIREVQTLLGGKDMLQDTHRHNFFFVLALKEGDGTHLIDFVPYQIRPCCIFIMKPGQVHQLELKKESSGYLMEFSREFYHVSDRGTTDILRKAASLNSYFPQELTFNRIHKVLQNIFEEYTGVREGFHEAIRAQLDIFFIELLRTRKDVTPANNVVAYEQERLEEFLRLVETHFASKKQPSQYAGMLNLSLYQLNNITKRLLAKTPSQVLTEFIILEAKRNLLATSDQVNQIAWRLGFEDPSYFIRFFRKYTGFSPEVFRTNSN